MAATAGLSLALDNIWWKLNCAWVFIGWCSTNFRFSVPIWNSKWRLRQDFGPYGKNVSKRFFSEFTWTIETKLPRNDHWEVLYKVLFLMPIRNPIWAPPQDIYYHSTLWENVQMPSSQKLHIWLKPNCTWMFIGWSSTNMINAKPYMNPIAE